MLDNITGTIGSNINVLTDPVWQGVNDFVKTGTPDFTIYLNGEDINTYFHSRLISLKITDKRSFNADEMDIVLSNIDNTLPFTPTKKLVNVYLGWKGFTLVEKGTFIIDQITYSGVPDKIMIHATSADLSSSLTTANNFSWHDTTIDNIVHTIAKRHSLFYSVAAPFKNVHINHIDQSGESDAAFLTRLAIRHGAEFSIKKHTALFLNAGSGLTASGQKIKQVIINQSDCKDYSFASANRFNYTGVSAQWLDTRTPSQQINQAMLLRQRDRTAVNNAADSSSGAGGSNPPLANEIIKGKRDNLLALKRLYPSKEEAEKAVQDAWKICQQETYTCVLTLAKGREDIYPETSIKLEGFRLKQLTDKEWIVRTATHTVDKQGFTTKLELDLKIKDTDANELPHIKKPDDT